MQSLNIIKPTQHTTAYIQQPNTRQEMTSLCKLFSTTLKFSHKAVNYSNNNILPCNTINTLYTTTTLSSLCTYYTLLRQNKNVLSIHNNNIQHTSITSNNIQQLYTTQQRFKTHNKTKTHRYVIKQVLLCRSADIDYD